MYPILSVLVVILGLTGCAVSVPEEASQTAIKRIANHRVVDKTQVAPVLQSDIKKAIAAGETPPASQKVLRTIDDMMGKKEVIVGSCWDYLNEAFTRAGYPSSHRQQVFVGKYAGGPYADSDLIKPGDWLYYVNHSYHNIEHSGLFIRWTDKKRKRALIFSYAGEGRKNPARMRVYHIDKVFRIIRAQK